MKKFIVFFAASTFGVAMLAGAPPTRAATATPSPTPSPAAAGSAPQYYPNQPWAVPPAQWQAAEQKGFRAGVRGAYKDAQNHRPPNVNNRDEYRHPDDVPGGDVGAYQQGFRRGYWTGVQHLMGYYHGSYPSEYQQYEAQQQGVYPNESWANPPAGLKEAQRKGFHDGVEGARQDAKNGRTPNVNNRDEYRHPDVPRREWGAYREGFQQGYQVGVEHLMHRGYHHDHDR